MPKINLFIIDSKKRFLIIVAYVFIFNLILNPDIALCSWISEWALKDYDFAAVERNMQDTFSEWETDFKESQTIDTYERYKALKEYHDRNRMPSMVELPSNDPYYIILSNHNLSEVLTKMVINTKNGLSAFPSIFEPNNIYSSITLKESLQYYHELTFLVQQSKSKAMYEILVEYTVRNALYSMFVDGNLTVDAYESVYKLMYEVIEPQMREFYKEKIINP